MSLLKNQVQSDMIAAMRAKDARLGTIRLLWAAIRQKEIDERIELDDALVFSVIEKMIKQRKDSIAQYQSGGRPELAERELAEINILQAYLPAQFTEMEITAIIKNAIATVAATSVKDMGKVMAEVKAKAQGRADMAKVSALIKDFLQSTPAE